MRKTANWGTLEGRGKWQLLEADRHFPSANTQPTDNVILRLTIEGRNCLQFFTPQSKQNERLCWSTARIPAICQMINGEINLESSEAVAVEKRTWGTQPRQVQQRFLTMTPEMMTWPLSFVFAFVFVFVFAFFLLLCSNEMFMRCARFFCAG